MAQRFVIDPSALAQAFFSDTFSAQAHNLAQRATLPERSAIAVRLSAIEFAIVECTNIFWKRHSFFGLPLSDAQIALDRLARFPLQVFPALSLMKRSLELAATYKLAVYDSTYIALAESLAVPLISTDQKQIDAATKAGISIKPLTDFT
jgi:predicted nucleic acid-binding protein